MDTGGNRGYQRGRGRGNRRGRFRGRAHYNHYFDPYYTQESYTETDKDSYDSSQKDESYSNSTHPYRGHSRGRGRGGRYHRGGYRSNRGGRGRGYGEYQNYYQEEHKHNKQPNPNLSEHKPPVKFEHGEYNRRNTKGDPPISYVSSTTQEDNHVYYQADDFLKKYDRLPEKTEYLVKELCEGTIQ